MNRDDLVEQLRNRGSDLIRRNLPRDARDKLDALISDRHYEVDTQAFMTFSSVRALLHEGGMSVCESDREAAQVLAHLNRR